MAYTTTVSVNRPEVYALLLDRVTKIGNKVQNVARRRAPKKTGVMAASIHVIVNSAPGFVFADIGTHIKYAYWRHEGTGIYAGHGPIRATGGGYMRFLPGRPIGPIRPQGKFHRGPRKPSVYVYARTVKGMPGSPFLVSALGDVIGGVGRIRRFT